MPRQCGIATFTADICESVAAEYPECECIVGAVNDRPEGYDYPTRIRFEIDEKELDSYRRAADFLNINNVEVVSRPARVRHLRRAGRQPSAGFAARSADAGGDDAAHRAARAERRRSARSWSNSIALSNRFVVMAERGREILEKIYGVAAGQDRSDPARRPGHAVHRSELSTRISSAWRARRCC